MPSLITNVREKRPDGLMSISRSRMEAILLHPCHMFNYLEPKLWLPSPFFVLFDPAELRTPLSKDLLAELEWQAQKAKETEELYI
jgi:hypothetical protein